MISGSVTSAAVVGGAVAGGIVSAGIVSGAVPDGVEPGTVPGGADVFVGYGGVQVREAVEKGADWFVTDFDAFIDVVKSKR